MQSTPTNKFLLLLTILFLGTFSISDSLKAQSPPNTNANIPANPGFTTIADIQNSFNAARRAEETQLGAPANSLGNLVLPANWDAMSTHAKGLFLTNAERVARGGVPYAGVTPIGLPVEMVETNLQNVAIAHGNDMLANQRWAHANSMGQNSFTRIGANPVLSGCLDFLPRAENLFISCHFGPNNRVVEAAIYGWIYNDLGSNNGHREANLIQDTALGGGTGFLNNYSSAANEGFIAFHTFTALSTVYNPAQFQNACGAPSANWSYSVAIFNIADPAVMCNNPGFGTPFNPGLPVELVSWNGLVDDESTVKLAWETASETNNLGFSVEYKIGSQFEEIGFIDGAGTTESSQYYSFEMGPVEPGIHVFRLKQIDFDGTFEYSSELELEVGIPNRVSISKPFPNPFATSTEFTVAAAKDQEISVQIFDSKGRLVAQPYSGMVTAGQRERISLGAAGLHSGIYIARVTGEFFSETSKLVVIK